MNTHETVMAAIRQQLVDKVVAAAGYAHPPEAVLRLVFMPEGWAPDETYRVAYYMWPEAELTRLGPSSCEKTSDLQVAIRACRRMELASENPNAQDQQRWQFAADMFTDIREAIFEDPTFGNVARHLADNQISVDYQNFDAAYAIADVRFVVRFAMNRPGR